MKLFKRWITLILLSSCWSLAWSAEVTFGVQESKPTYHQAEVDFRLDPERVRIVVKDRQAESIVRRVFEELDEAKRFSPMDFVITEDGEMRGDRLITFTQLIDGIPFSIASYVRITNEGEIVKVYIAKAEEFLTAIVDENGAWQIAEAALLAKLQTNQLSLRQSSVRPTGRSMSLSYQGTARGIVPIWDVMVDVDNSLSLLGPTEIEEIARKAGKNLEPATEKKIRDGLDLTRGYYRVVIDANSGEVLGIVDRLQGKKFAVAVCEHEGNIFGDDNPNAKCVNHPLVLPGGITWPNHYTVKKVFDSGACLSPADCNSPVFKTPKDIITDFENWIDSNSVECCSGMAKLHVMTNSDYNDWNYIQYRPEWDAIHIPKAGDLVPGTFLPGNIDLGQDVDAVVHETAHHIQDQLNYHLTFRSISVQYPDYYAEGIIEGMADALVALYQKDHLGASDAEAWVIGEHVIYNARDLRVPKYLEPVILEEDFQHLNGQIFGNFIYRAVQDGADPGEMANMILFIMKYLSVGQGEDGMKYDHNDLLKTVKEFLVESTTSAGLEAILRGVWEDMGGIWNPPISCCAGGTGGGSSGSAPPTPGWILSPPFYCFGQISNFNVSWQSVSSADRYSLNAIPAGSPWPTDYVITTGTSVVFSANVPGRIDLRACNGSLCSSPISTFIIPFCGTGN